MTTPRRRDAAATKEAILRAGIEAFTRHGYDGVGVREIAKAAGVTAMLVGRYFGSKEGLFAEVVEASMTERTVLTSDPATLARDVAAALVRRTAPEADSLDPFLLMLRSAPNPAPRRSCGPASRTTSKPICSTSHRSCGEPNVPPWPSRSSRASG